MYQNFDLGLRSENTELRKSQICIFRGKTFYISLYKKQQKSENRPRTPPPATLITMPQIIAPQLSLGSTPNYVLRAERSKSTV